MWRHRRKYINHALPLILPAILSLNVSLSAQTKISKDSVNLSKPGKVIQVPGQNTFSISGTPVRIPVSPVPPGTFFSERTPVFFDSLRLKASKHLITKKIYDFVVVSNKTTPGTVLSKSSDLYFAKYSGRKIRNIEIQRLSVFGSDINAPGSIKPNKAENLLNKTHLNTNEFIIRKNLLFVPGDTVSPLILSDNERILRQLPFIEDSRIVVVPVSSEEADIIVITKDVYSLGADFNYSGIKKGSISVFDKNILGIGHEFRLEMPYNSELPDSPGFGIVYKADNISKSFINLNLYYYDGLGEKTYGLSLERKLVSSATKYAGGISIREMFTTEDLDTLVVAEPLKYNLQDYWLSRSFLINRESVSRIIFGLRYTNNNVFNHPFILPDSYHYLQKYRLYLGSAAFSVRKFYKTNLIFSYGPTEDVPYGGLLTATVGKEINEFRDRIYGGVDLSFGKSIRRLGYLFSSAGFSSFFQGGHTEQGIMLLRARYFSNLLYLGSYRVRNFVKIDYTRGFDRNSDEHLEFNRDDGFSGFRNDSIGGQQRLSANIESVFFSPASFLGFKFALFGFADLGYLFGTNEFVGNGEVLSSIGLGIRVRNDHLVFNTFQVRIGFFPNLPPYSTVNNLVVSGKQRLNPDNFDPGPPSIIQYR